MGSTYDFDTGGTNMGMFEDVTHNGKPLVTPCPRCSGHVSGYQTKDGPCQMGVIEWTDDRVCNIYSICNTCRQNVDLEVINTVDLDSGNRDSLLWEPILKIYIRPSGAATYSLTIDTS